LGIWVSTQRKNKIKGQISAERLNRLTALGFDWDPFASAWEENFHTIEQYKAKHSNCNVPIGCPKNPVLGRWVSGQRQAKSKGRISKERVDRLTVIGFDWDPIATAWGKSFRTLEQYKVKYGHCIVPKGCSENPGLDGWVSRQRRLKIKGRLLEEQVTQLTALGFDWDPFTSAWEENFCALGQYRAKYGDCNVPRVWPENPSLSIWIKTQRAAKIEGDLSKEHGNRLTALGFEWDPFASAWEENFLALEQYKAKHGDCNIPSRCPKNTRLANWVSTQRAVQIKGQLSKERLNRLTAIGFIWDPLAAAWEENFRALEQYKAKHGNCNVPREWPENPGLARWVKMQRAAKIKEELSKEQINKLIVLGFDWDLRASAWEESIRTLEQYKAKHGDCNVPRRWSENPSLAAWVSTLRQVKGQLSKERANQLTGLGFEWDPFASAWEKSFLALEQYKAKHGDCNVPFGWPENPSLGHWVSMQRKLKIKGQLSKERVDRLATIRFEWHRHRRR